MLRAAHSLSTNDMLYSLCLPCDALLLLEANQIARGCSEALATLYLLHLDLTACGVNPTVQNNIRCLMSNVEYASSCKLLASVCRQDSETALTTWYVLQFLCTHAEQMLACASKHTPRHDAGSCMTKSLLACIPRQYKVIHRACNTQRRASTQGR